MLDKNIDIIKSLENINWDTLKNSINTESILVLQCK